MERKNAFPSKQLSYSGRFAQLAFDIIYDMIGYGRAMSGFVLKINLADAPVWTVDTPD